MPGCAISSYEKEAFLCPLTNDFILDPVILGTDKEHIYSREALEDFIRTYAKHPITHKHMHHSLIQSAQLPSIKSAAICTLKEFYETLTAGNLKKLKKLHWLKEYVTLPLDHYCKVEQKGWTALHYVVGYQQQEMLRELLEKDINADVGDEKGVTPLHLAVLKNKPEMVELLVKHSSLHTKDKQGQTALDYALKFDRSAKMIELLIDANDINHQNKETGWTSLHEMANKGYVEGVKALLASGASKWILDVQGRMPLHLAAAHGRLDLIPLLADDKTINAEDDDAWTPLHWVISNTYPAHDMGKNLEVVRLLIEKGANPQARDQNDKLPIDLADSRLKKAIQEILGDEVDAKKQIVKSDVQQAVETRFNHMDRAAPQKRQDTR
jgi:ankyrin repeat protein